MKESARQSSIHTQLLHELLCSGFWDSSLPLYVYGKITPSTVLKYKVYLPRNLLKQHQVNIQLKRPSHTFLTNQFWEKASLLDSRQMVLLVEKHPLIKRQNFENRFSTLILENEKANFTRSKGNATFELIQLVN